MRLLSTLRFLMPVLVVGCDGDETGGTARFEPTTACANIVAYCPTGYTWSGFASDAASCRSMFSCVRNLYTGSCRQIIADGVTCLEDVSAASDCSACNTIITRATTECSEPTSCLTN